MNNETSKGKKDNFPKEPTKRLYDPMPRKSNKPNRIDKGAKPDKIIPTRRNKS